jgi:hypothetical protein
MKLAIEQGFEPYASPFVKEGPIEKMEGNSFFCQAVIKPAKAQL